MDPSTIQIIIYCACAVGEALIIGVPAILKIVSSLKQLKNAKTNEEKLSAIDDMKKQVKIFIEAAEIAYKDINDTLKAKGQSAGSAKKDSVMLKLQSYAESKNYVFDADFWSQEIDEEVRYTKNVNSK